MRMMHRLAAVLMAVSIAWMPIAANAADQQENPQITAARKSRDARDVEGLRKAIKSAHDEAHQKNSAEAFQLEALFDLWMCEAAHGNNDDALVKSAATDGLAAAEKATALNPSSSEAHRLQGDLLSQLIPVVFAGGMRYGARSSGEFDKAIELDPKNPDAYIGRALSYFFTPSMFGGSRDKAIELLKKALTIDASSDTAHLWLAQVYLDGDKTDDAEREINEARRIDPNRGFTNYVADQIKAKANKQAKR